MSLKGGGEPTHILIAVLGALAAAFWAFTYFVNAAREGQDALRDVKGAFRGAKWSRKIDKRLHRDDDGSARGGGRAPLPDGRL